MEHIGIDVHKNQSQICILTEAGELVHRRIGTERSRFAEVLGERPKARILIEASTESEWVARCLEELGHEVIVADPNYAPMYAHRSRRVKTDRRDAEALSYGLPARGVPASASCVGRAAARAGFAIGAGRCGPYPGSLHRTHPGAVETARVSSAEWSCWRKVKKVSWLIKSL